MNIIGVLLLAVLALLALALINGGQIIATLYALDATGILPWWHAALALALAGLALAWLFEGPAK